LRLGCQDSKTMQHVESFEDCVFVDICLLSLLKCTVVVGCRAIMDAIFCIPCGYWLYWIWLTFELKHTSGRVWISFLKFLLLVASLSFYTGDGWGLQLFLFSPPQSFLINFLPVLSPPRFCFLQHWTEPSASGCSVVLYPLNVSSNVLLNVFSLSIPFSWLNHCNHSSSNS
jgi:hypothetical protein